MPPEDDHRYDIVRPYEYASENAERPELVANAIRRYNLTREMVFGAAMGHRKIWEALFEGMPMTAMIHNLGTLTRLGIAAPVSDAARRVAEPVDDADALRTARVHPIAIPSAPRASGLHMAFPSWALLFLPIFPWPGVQPVTVKVLPIAARGQYCIPSGERFWPSPSLGPPRGRSRAPNFRCHDPGPTRAEAFKQQ